LSYPGALPEV